MLDKADRLLVRVNSALAAIILAVMVVLVFANVVGRYLFDYSFSWVEEVTRYMMIWLAYLCAGLALRHRRHVAVELLHDALPGPAMLAVRALVVVVILGFFAAVAWYGFRYAAFAWMQSTPVLGLSLGLIYLAIPIGSLLMIVHLLLVLRPYVTRELDMDEAMGAGGQAVAAPDPHSPDPQAPDQRSPGARAVLEGREAS
ncbi:MAG TPA: TRAP transporter small permease [Azospirillum sp.]